MNDLEKFKKNVNSLEEEMSNLLKIAEVYKKVASMATEFEKSVEKIGVAEANLDKAIKSLETQKQQINSEMKDILGKIDVKSEEMKKSYKDAHKEMAGNIELKLTTFRDDIKSTFRNENGTLVTKMNSIKTEMLTASIGLKDKISTMSLEVNSMRQEQAKASEMEKIKNLVIGTLVAGAVAVVLCIILLVK